MAETGSPLIIELVAMGQQFTQGLKTAEGQVKAWGAQTEATMTAVEEKTANLGHLWRSLFEASIAFGIIAAFKGMAQAASDAKLKFDEAANSAHNLNKSFDKSGMEKWVDQFAASAAGGGYAIDDIRSAVQKFAAIGLKDSQIKRAIASATNLAAARNFDFAKAVQISTMALTGHVPLLTRYGILTTAQAKQITTTEQAMEFLAKAGYGAAALRAQSLEGATGELNNALHVLGESVGQYVLPFFKAAIQHFTDMVRWLNDLNPNVKMAASLFGLFVGSLSALALVLPAIKVGFEFLFAGFRTITSGIQIAIKFFGLLVDLLIGPVIRAFQAVVAWLQLYKDAQASATLATWAGQAPWLAIVAVLALVGIAVYEVAKHWDVIHAKLMEFRTWFINDFVPVLRDGFFGIFDLMTGNAGAAAKDFGRYAQDIGHVWQGVWKNIGAGAESLWDRLKKGWASLKSWLEGNTTFGPPPADDQTPYDNNQVVKPTKGGKGNRDGTFTETIRSTAINAIDKFMDLMRKQDVGTMVGFERGRAEAEASLQASQTSEAMEGAKGTLTPAKSAAYAVAQDELRYRLAALAAAAANAKYDLDSMAKDANTVAGQQRLLNDQKALDTALIAVTQASDNLEVSLAKSAKVAQEVAKSNTIWGNLKDKLEQAAPEITAFINAMKAGTNPWVAAFSELLANTRSFQLVMQAIGNIFKILGRVIDAVLMPILHRLDQVLTFVVNIFIDLWNTMAALLRVLGIHVGVLQHINTLFGNMDNSIRPLLDVIHDLPTIKEYGSGNYGALQPDQYGGGNSIVGAINNQTNSQKGWFGNVIGILLGVLAALLLLKVLGGLGGIGGGFGKLFSGGAIGKLGAWIGQHVFGGMPAFEGGLANFFNGQAGSMGTIATSVIAGAVFGQIMGGGSHTDWGAIGGLIGSFIPIPGAGLILGAIGSLFGHADNKQNMPDKYLPGYQAYLQMFNDHAGDGNQQLTAFLQGGGAAGLSGQAAADAARLKQLGGSNYDLGIASEKNDVFTLGSGQQVNVEDYIALTTRALQEFSGALGQGASQLGQAMAGMIEPIRQLTNVVSGSASGGIAPRAIGSGVGGMTISQQIQIDNVESVANIEALQDSFAWTANQALRTRAYAQGN